MEKQKLILDSAEAASSYICHPRGRRRKKKKKERKKNCCDRRPKRKKRKKRKRRRRKKNNMKALYPVRLTMKNSPYSTYFLESLSLGR